MNMAETVASRSGNESYTRHSSVGESEHANEARGSTVKTRNAKVKRTGRACDACAKVKMRCDAGSHEGRPCQRCSRQGYDCTYHNADARERRKSKPPSSSTVAGGRSSVPVQASVSEQPTATDLSVFPQASTGEGPVIDLSASSYAQSGFTLPQPIFQHAPPPATQPADNSFNRLNRSLHLSGPAMNDSSVRSEVAMATADTRIPMAQASAPTPAYEPSQSDSSPGSRVTPLGNTNSANTPGKSGTSRSRELRQLVNPLGLLVFASLDVPEPAQSGKSTIVGQLAQSDPSGWSTDSLESDRSAGAPESEAPLTATNQDIYFRSGARDSVRAAPRQIQRPAAYRILSAEQIQELFDIFYKHFHVHAPITDPEHSKPEEIARRSHFLFHTICAIAMRGWSGPSDKQEKLLKIMLSHLKLLPNERTLGCVQANLLCATWNPVSSQHVDLDEQYIRVGLAIRLAMDLRLHLTDTEANADVPDWILYEKRRTWALCYVFESKMSAHRHQECHIPTTGLAGLDRLPDDKRMLSSVEWCRIVTRTNKQHPDGFSREQSVDPAADQNQSNAMLSQCDAIEIELMHWKDHWISAFSSFPHNLQVLVARIRLYYHYAQLLNCAHAVQSISGKPDWADSAYAAKYLDAVVRMLYTFVEDFGVHRTATYLSDLHFTCTAFSAVSLIHSLTLGIAGQSYQAASSVRLINRVADVFEASSGDYGHNLRNQAHYLRAVLTAKLDEQGKPRVQSHQTTNETDWSTFNFNDFIYDPPTRPPEQIFDNWEAMFPAGHDLTSLDAFLNANVESAAIQSSGGSAYWDNMLDTSANSNGHDASRFMPM